MKAIIVIDDPGDDKPMTAAQSKAISRWYREAMGHVEGQCHGPIRFDESVMVSRELHKALTFGARHDSSDLFLKATKGRDSR